MAGRVACVGIMSEIYFPQNIKDIVSISKNVRNSSVRKINEPELVFLLRKCNIRLRIHQKMNHSSHLFYLKSDF